MSMIVEALEENVWVFCPFGMALHCCEYSYWHLDTAGRAYQWKFYLKVK